ncbi:hypothetical protein AVEN_129187-1 [Araneus ventricosus]|uniref:Uncharacterized protein n=1 Tax=Araneus ventricosus TaxID=182803 RepID=A0A4Y2H5H0_ARAVE|nr:hypothetical protein AVEN_129187-1 [Araneus ventricosus]
MYAYPFECLARSLAIANFKGRCCLQNWDGKSFGIIGMSGIKTLSPFSIPIMTVACTTFGPKCVICNRVPLQSLGTSRLCINSTATRLLISACRKVPLTIPRSCKTLQDMMLLAIAH